MRVSIFIFFAVSFLGYTISGTDRGPNVTRPSCDLSSARDLREGIVRDDRQFAWLGLLTVHLEENRDAVTGIILVRAQHAIANAYELARIPDLFLKQNSTAVFNTEDRRPLHARLDSRVVHPDSQNVSNTIALLILNKFEHSTVLLKPVCFPKEPLYPSQLLYMIGYADENKKLEKIIYKVQYVRPTLCDVFYERLNLTEQALAPAHYHCAVGASFKRDCTWDSGMALVSNSSGRWTLLGLSTRGPGCAAPSRYIDLHPYLDWIDEQTRHPPESRRTGVFKDQNIGKASGRQSTPLHRFYGKHKSQRIDDSIPLVIDRIDDNAVQIFVFGDLYERNHDDCSRIKVLAYRDRLRIVDRSHHEGQAVYRLSMYDMYIRGYTCIQLRIVAKERRMTYMWYRLELDKEVWGDLPQYPYITPDGILNRYPIPRVPERENPQYYNPGGYYWKPGPHLEPKPIEAPYIKNLVNVNILIGFNFTSFAYMDLKIYGPPQAPPYRPPLTTTRRTTTEYTTYPPTRQTRPPWASSWFFWRRARPNYQPIDHRPLNHTTEPSDLSVIPIRELNTNQNLYTTTTERATSYGKPKHLISRLYRRRTTTVPPLRQWNEGRMVRPLGAHTVQNNHQDLYATTTQHAMNGIYRHWTYSPVSFVPNGSIPNWLSATTREQTNHYLYVTTPEPVLSDKPKQLYRRRTTTTAPVRDWNEGRWNRPLDAESMRGKDLEHLYITTTEHAGYGHSGPRPYRRRQTTPVPLSEWDEARPIRPLGVTSDRKLEEWRKPKWPNSPSRVSDKWRKAMSRTADRLAMTEQ